MFVVQMDGRSHEQFSYLGWLPVSKRVDQIMLCHVHKVNIGFAPDYLGEHFKPLTNAHTCCTRSNKVAQPVFKHLTSDFTYVDTGRFSTT